MIWLVIFIAALVFGLGRPRRAGALILLALPLYLLRLQLFGLPTTVLEAAALGATAGFYLNAVMIGEARALFRTIKTQKFFWPTIFLFAASLLAALATRGPLIPALGLWRAYFLEPIIALPLLFYALGDAKTRDALFRLLALEAAAIAVFALVQRLGLAPISEPWTAERRATSIYPYPNAVGLFLAPQIVAFATLAFFRANRDRLIYAAAAILCFGGIVASNTDAGIATVLLLVFVLALVKGGKTRLAAIALAVIALVALAVAPSARIAVLEKASFRGWSGIVRLQMWSETYAMLQTTPFLGAGLNGYQTAVKPFHRDSNIEIFQYPHNEILTVWSELGLLGLIVWLAILVAFIRTLHLERRDETWVWRLAATAAAAQMLLHGLADVPYFKNDLAFLTWIFLILPAAAHAASTKPAERDNLAAP